jgi:hypothetical protein
MAPGSDPQGLKPEFIVDALRGADAALFTVRLERLRG